MAPDWPEGSPKPLDMNVFKASRFLAMVAIVATFWACDQKDDASPDQNEVVGKWKLQTKGKFPDSLPLHQGLSCPFAKGNLRINPEVILQAHG